MNDNDGRDSVVPRGTFGSSAPPPAEEAPSDEERARRYTRTLLGHPSATSASGERPSRPRSTAKVLSPPKWRGAEAYREGGEEPQPEVRSIPSPGPVPSGPVEGMPVARITPRPAFQAADEIGPAADQRSADADVPYDPEIEEIVEDVARATRPSAGAARPRDSEPEELPSDVLEAFEEPEPPPAPVSSAPATTLAAESRARSGIALRLEEEPIDTSARNGRRKPQERTPATESSQSSSDSAEPEEQVATALEHVSLSPSERTAEPPSDDAAPRLGFLAVAAIALIGGGFWVLTRGTYDGPGPGRDVPGTPAAAAQPQKFTPSSEPAKRPAAVPAPSDDSAPSAVASQSTAAEPSADTPSIAPKAAAEQKASAQGPKGAGMRRADKRKRRAARALDRPQEQPQPAPEPEPSNSDAELSDTPTREDVLAALEPMNAQVRKCANGQSGVAEVDITVTREGAVTHAVVSGDFAGTPEGSCIARVVRKAKFAPFKKPRFRVIYPFRL